MTSEQRCKGSESVNDAVICRKSILGRGISKHKVGVCTGEEASKRPGCLERRDNGRKSENKGYCTGQCQILRSSQLI